MNIRLMNASDYDSVYALIGFSVRTYLVYRNKALAEIKRIDT